MAPLPVLHLSVIHLSRICHSWKLLIAKPSITLQLPKPMNAFPVSTCISGPQMLLTAAPGDPPLLALVTPFF